MERELNAVVLCSGRAGRLCLLCLLCLIFLRARLFPRNTMAAGKWRNLDNTLDKLLTGELESTRCARW